MQRYSYVRNKRSLIWTHTHTHTDKNTTSDTHTKTTRRLWLCVCTHNKAAWRLWQQKEDNCMSQGTLGVFVLHVKGTAGDVAWVVKGLVVGLNTCSGSNPLPSFPESWDDGLSVVFSLWDEDPPQKKSKKTSPRSCVLQTCAYNVQILCQWKNIYKFYQC